MLDSSPNAKTNKDSDLSSCSFSLMRNYQSLQIIEWFPVHRENTIPLNLCNVEEITNELCEDISNLWGSTFFSWHPSGWKKQDQFWKVFLRKRRFDWCSVRGKQNLWYFFFSKHRSAWFLLRKKNNLSSDCILYFTLGLLIFYLLNLYDFPTFSSFGIQPVPSPYSLIEAPYKISSEDWDWGCNKITQKVEQLAQITRLQLFPHFHPWFAHLLAVEYIYLIWNNMKIFSDNFNLLL